MSIDAIRGKPFTVAHFRRYAREIVLDTGEPFVVEKFQAAFLKDFFAGIPECWLIVPEGNGKTTFIAALCLYVCDYIDSADIPVAASSRDQAGILYRQAEGMVNRSPMLYDDERFKCQEGYRRIKNLNTGGRIQIFASDDRTGDGVIPTLAVCDELHRHRSLDLYRTWRGKLAKRGGQLATISTAGEPGSEFEMTREKIRSEAKDSKSRGSFIRAASPGIVMHEWSVPSGADVKDLRVVKAANPFSGVTIKNLEETFQSPAMTIDHWKRFSCNIATRGGSAAITDAEWRAMDAGMQIPEGEMIWLGIDAAWKWDTFAIVPFWAPDSEHRLLGAAKILVPPRDGTSLEINRVKLALLEIHKRNPIELVVMDTSSAEDVAEWIRGEFDADVIDRGQGNTFAVRDYNNWMDAMRNGWLYHSGDEGLKKHALNAVTKMLPGGDARFDRPKQNRRTAQQDRRVIDALTAAAMVNSAYAATLVEDESKPTSWRPM